MTPEAEFIVTMDVLAWSVWGTAMAYSLHHEARSWEAKAFIVVTGGIAVWGIALWRGILIARHSLMHRLGVDKCGCHHH